MTDKILFERVQFAMFLQLLGALPLDSHQGSAPGPHWGLPSPEPHPNLDPPDPKNQRHTVYNLYVNKPNYK